MLLFAVLLTWASPLARGQFLSGMEGTVRDQSGALVGAAKVTATNSELGVTRTTATSTAGYFRIDSIAASTYTVRIEASGFQNWEQKDLVVTVGQISTVAPVLRVASAPSEITVSASAEAAVNLAAPQTASVIEGSALHEAPLPGQNIFHLLPLTAAVTGNGITSGDIYTTEYAININAAGLRQEQNGFTIDGVQTNTPSRGGSTSITPGPAIVESVEVRTNDFDAQKGRNAGAITNIFTRSGSNQYHGSVDYFYTDDSLSALTHFESTLPPSRRNEVSGAVGGPILKNKLFWFGAFDVLRSHVTNSGSATVETQDLYNWVKANLPNTVAYQALTMQPPASYATAASPGGLRVGQIKGSFFPPPSGIPADLDALGNVNYTTTSPKNGHQESFRIDLYLNDKDRIYAHVLRTDYNSTFPSPRPAFSVPTNSHTTFVNVDWTHTFSSKILNEAGVDVIRPYGENLANPQFAVPNINVTGMQGFGNWGPGNFAQQTVGWRDVMRAIVKTHSLKFGFEQFNIRENDSQGGAFDRPTYNFDSLLDFIQDEAVTATGTPVNLQTHQEAPYERRYRELFSAFYIQDDWKVIPRLTVNAGLRYDQMTNMFSIYSPPLTNFTLGNDGDFNNRIRNGTVGLNPNRNVLDHNLWGLTPRLGFAWDVFGTGKTALRAGVGAFRDQPPYLHITDLVAGNPPNFFTPGLDVRSGQTIDFQLCHPPQGFTISCPVVPTNNVTVDPNTGAVIIGGTVSRAALGGYSPSYKMGQVLTWTLSVQHELRRDLVAEVNYSATAAHHLPTYNQDLNRFAGDLIINKGTLVRLNPNFGPINYATAEGNSSGNYVSGIISKRYSHGISFRGIYTFGHAIDTLSNSGSLANGAITSSNQNGPVVENGNLVYQRGRADFDIRQQFGFEGSWLVPSHYSNAWARNLLGGWQFTGMWLMQTGLPFSVYTGAGFAPVFDNNGNVIGNTGGDYNADGSNYDVPNVPSFGRHLSGRGKDKFLNGLFPASAFPAPVLGLEGSLGRNTYDGPGYNNVDFTAAKAFSVPWFFGEKLKLEGRGEFYNLFNRVNLTAVSGDLSSGTFGKASSQLPARSIQLHVRATF